MPIDANKKNLSFPIGVTNEQVRFFIIRSGRGDADLLHPVQVSKVCIFCCLKVFFSRIDPKCPEYAAQNNANPDEPALILPNS
jgi:hypothetical protein